MNTDAELCKRIENEWNTLSTDLIVTVWEEEMKRIKIGEPGPGRRVTVNSWMQTDEENPLLKPGDALVCVLVCACLWSVLISPCHSALISTHCFNNNRKKGKQQRKGQRIKLVHLCPWWQPVQPSNCFPGAFKSIWTFKAHRRVGKYSTNTTWVYFANKCKRSLCS